MERTSRLFLAVFSILFLVACVVSVGPLSNEPINPTPPTPVPAAATATKAPQAAPTQPLQPANTATLKPNITPQVTLKNISPVPTHEAAKVITAFAEKYLGLNITVTKSTGVAGEILLPPIVKDTVSASVKMAGQVAAGTYKTAKDQVGFTQVSVGKGTVTGDLNGDISGASLGAYSLIIPAQTFNSSMQALAVLRQSFPGLNAANLSEMSTQGGGYAFESTFNRQGVEWKSKQVTMVACRIVAGINKLGTDTFAWVVIANGEFVTK